MATTKLNPTATPSSKTMYRTSLVSGSSWTVPANVTYVNVTLTGGGAGGMGGNYASTGWGGFQPQAVGGQVISSTVSTTPGASIAYSIGAGGTGQSANGATQAGAGGSTTFTGAQTAAGGGAHANKYGTPATPSNVRANNGGLCAYSQPGQINSEQAGGAGGAGQIDIEYWA